jgi:F-type H+-transporting ATPase subunit a
MFFNFQHKLIIGIIAMVLCMAIPAISNAQPHDTIPATEGNMPQAEPENGNALISEEGAGHSNAEEGFSINKVLFGHVMDTHDWHLFSYGKGHDATHISMPLPVIVYTATKGLNVFSSSRFHHGHESHLGFSNPAIDGTAKHMKEKITADDGSKVYDFSITKNVFCMLLSVLILFLIMFAVAKRSKSNGANKAPTGIQNAVEPIVSFIRDGVAKPYLGDKYQRYLPLLLTFFFFIWINNLLGLLPFGFNFTGNIAVTLFLALVFFVVMLFSSNKYYWGHILNPPGVPLAVKFILVPIEILGIFIKPVALALRLFANMFAGHTIIICVISLIFIFGKQFGAGLGWGTTLISVPFTIFMFFLELLVAAIQAFIFTNLVAVFIGQAIEEHPHDDAHDAAHAKAH